YKRIDLRVDCMFEKGLLDEVKCLLSSGVSFDSQSMQAIGYKEFKDFVENNADINVIKDKIKQNSRNYAKRQITWLKKYEFAKWFDPMTEIGLAEEYILQYIRS
ncbi:MAG: tRNA (adenosine(37)-N6)-dimethylallyltransferase MiaA, partial [Clostridia bacterium]|nr:tRNA (adenosine(37)-N6)-dimethylallyltransferase MiaA [Clostridia bacterium]